MNVLLVNPPSSFLLKSFNKISSPDIPLNLAYIAAVIEADGHFVRIIDMNVIKSYAELKERLDEAEFDVLGFTATTPIFQSCLNTIQILKKKFPRSKIILGGWHASTLPVETMGSVPEIDFIVKGEGECTIRELMKAIEMNNGFASIQGIVYRDTNLTIHENQDRPLIQNLDTLPYPARQLLPLEEYKKMGLYTFGGYYKKDLYICSIISNRGCMGKCIFCGDSVIHKGFCRNRSPENVVAEIQHMIKKYKIRITGFLDANFLSSAVHVRRICELIIAKKLKIIWVCSARVDNVSEELLRLMKRAGCIRIAYGIESGSPKILKLMRKNIRISQIRNAIAITKKVGIPVYVYFIYGMPGETLEDARMSRQLLMETKPNFVTNSIATPYPRTKLFDLMRDEWHLTDINLDSFFNTVFNMAVETPYIKKVFKVQRKILRDFYLSPFFLVDTIKKLTSIYHLKFYFTAFLCFIKFIVGL